jgi:hypothetical protein
MPSLFIGLVSHVGSRFEISQGEKGLSQLLATAWRERGNSCEVEINTHDAYDPEARPITAASVWAAVDAQLRLEASWRTYLEEGANIPIHLRLRGRIGEGVVRARAIRRFWRPWRGAGRPGEAGFRMIRRLFNIEYSHRHLMQSGLNSGAEWILIIEDDASSPDIADCSDGLIELTQEFPECGYANVSESFALAELGIAHLLEPAAGIWRGWIPRAVMTSKRPVTNTVCAILYRREFLLRLTSEFDRIPMEPIVPIDWKVNIALRNLYLQGALSPAECLIVTPAPINQLSMR